MQNGEQQYQNNLAAVRLAQEILKEGRHATPEEKLILHAYSGWASYETRRHAILLGNALSDEVENLRLTDDQGAALRRSTLTAYYTPPWLAHLMWEAAGRLGLLQIPRTPLILEPAAGTGVFLGTRPLAIPEDRCWGAELDPLGVQVLQALYPEMQLHKGALETANLPWGHFDLVIGNVPFSEVPIYDPRIPKHLRRTTHDYFLLRAMDALRPGGVAILVAPCGVLDKGTRLVRQYLADRGELIHAMRLPIEVFLSLGAQVTSDLLIFQRRDHARPGYHPEWLDTTFTGVQTSTTAGDPLHTPEKEMRINAYYAKRRSQILGTWRMGYLRPILTGNLTQVQARLRDSLNRLPENILLQSHSEKAPLEAPKLPAKTRTGETRTTGAELLADRVLGAIRTLLSAEGMGEDGTAHRNGLHKLYKMLRGKVGPLGMAGQLGGPLYHYAQHVPGWAMIASLEDEHHDPAGLLLGPLTPPVRMIPVNTPQDALLRVIDMGEDLTPERVGAHLGLPADETERLLQGELWQLGPGGVWVTTAQFLSGDLPQKLDKALGWAALDERFQVHVDALTQALPQVPPFDSISIPFGAAWIPAAYYRQFLRHLFPTWGAVPDRETGVLIEYSSVTGQWLIKINAAEIISSHECIHIYGTPHFDAVELIEHGLQLKSPVAYDTDEKGNRIKNARETINACAKLDAIRRAWTSWLGSDPERREFLARRFRDSFAAFMPIKHNGSRLQFPGLAGQFSPHPHQLNGVARILSRCQPDDSVLVTHRVGAGKTATAILGTMKRLQLGLSTRAMVVVPKHLREQWLSTWRALYPGHRDWLLSSEDDTAIGRQALLAKSVGGDWKILLLTHEQFTAIPVEPEILSAYLQQELDDINEEKKELGEEARHSALAKHLLRESKRHTKWLETARVEQRARWDEITARQGAVISWAALRVDLLVVDEFHLFKSLPIRTRMEGVSGIANRESHRALDAAVKIGWLLCPDLFPGVHAPSHGKVVGLTGTPVTNSLVELWVMMRLLQPQMLRQKGLWHFDAWASVFTEQYQWPELDSVGRYKTRTRLRFRNVPQMLALLSPTWDRVPGDALPPRPGIVGGRMQVLPTPGSNELKLFTVRLAERADAISMRMVDPSVDNMLLVTHHGRLASLYNGPPEGVFPGAPGSIVRRRTKIDTLVEQVWELYHTFDAHAGMQLIFCDLFTPKVHASQKPQPTGEARKVGRPRRGERRQLPLPTEEKPAGLQRWENLGLYGVIADRLVAAGILRQEIAFIHDATSDEDRSALYAAANAGRIRVLIGSTQRMGTGVNVQRRALAAHHVTVPWRPDWLTQAEGRVQRWGNLFEAVYINAYPTEGSYDTVLWQIIETKARMIESIGDGTYEGEAVDDIAETALTASIAKAIALGDLRILHKVELEMQLDGLLREYRQHQEEERARQGLILSLPKEIQKLREERESLTIMLRWRTGGSLFLAHIADPLTHPQESPDGNFVYPENGWAEITLETTACQRLQALALTLGPFLRNHKQSPMYIVGAWRGYKLALCCRLGSTFVRLLPPEGACGGFIEFGVTSANWGVTFYALGQRLLNLEGELERIRIAIDNREHMRQSLDTAAQFWANASKAEALLTEYVQLCHDLGAADGVDQKTYAFPFTPPSPSDKVDDENEEASPKSDAAPTAG